MPAQIVDMHFGNTFIHQIESGETQMSWMGSHGPRRSVARWAAGGAAAAAATLAAGMMAAPPALAAGQIAVPCSTPDLISDLISPGSGTLVLAAGCVYDVTAALPTVDRNLTIVGSNDTIDVTSGHFTLLTNNGGNLAITNLTFTGADATTANTPGVISNDGVLTLTNDTFTGNTGVVGGAIQNVPGSSLTVNSSTFTDNEATGAGGGAIANGLTATTLVRGSSFTANAAPAGSGGAIDTLGGTVTVNGTATTFRVNTSLLGGGAISALEGTLRVANASFYGNSSGGDGGGVGNIGAAASVARSAFTGNFSDEDGGGLATGSLINLSSDTFTDNGAEDNGGAVDVGGARTTVNTSSLYHNVAITGVGGGIYRSAGQVIIGTSSLVIMNEPDNCSGVSC
jgi:predicted outer membrane repeat protein